jgi:hypothetical protein
MAAGGGSTRRRRPDAPPATGSGGTSSSRRGDAPGGVYLLRGCSYAGESGTAGGELAGGGARLPAGGGARLPGRAQALGHRKAGCALL